MMLPFLATLLAATEPPSPNIHEGSIYDPSYMEHDNTFSWFDVWFITALICSLVIAANIIINQPRRRHPRNWTKVGTGPSVGIEAHQRRVHWERSKNM